ncbi:MAG TPA: class I SAM-dependent methyltransferase [Acidimicrobiales bacterium]|nr:class I SAM-dependent methyltransferase [Acidimicrobiales bacterium]
MNPEDVGRAGGVRLIGDPVDDAESSDQRVLEVLAAAGDTSTGSDELAAGVTDRVSQYHLSRLRPNLLRPLTLGKGLRVLEVGAGTGALTRYLAETGADVVAVESNLQRARATAERCRAMGNVEIVCGPLDSFTDDERFDVLLSIGSVETVRRLRALVRPGGTVVTAVDNPLGVRSLVGRDEHDHAHAPWAGLAGYGPGEQDAGRWPRPRLADLLDDAGLGAQRWLFPFPDYRLPTAILTDRAYDRPDAVTFVDQIVRWPSSAGSSSPARVVDDRLAHRAFLDAGVGRDVANSFLVVAAEEAAAVGKLLPDDVDAWFFGRERLRIWTRFKQFSAGEAPFVDVRPAVAEARESQWLRQVAEPREAAVAGPTVEQLALEAMANGPEALGLVLGSWRAHLRAAEVPGPGDPTEEPHPFRLPGAGTLLPPDHVDVSLTNFVVDESGTHVLIDREWVVGSHVDSLLARVRALWWFAADLVRHGVEHPWSSRTTVDELTMALGTLCDTPVDAADLYRLRIAEADLQEKVTGTPVEQIHALLAEIGESSQVEAGVLGGLPFAALRRDVAALAEALTAAEEAAKIAEERVEALEQEVRGLTEHAHNLDGALAAERELREHLAERLREAEQRWQALERRFLFRVYRFLRRVVGAR